LSGAHWLQLAVVFDAIERMHRNMADCRNGFENLDAFIDASIQSCLWLRLKLPVTGSIFII
jgi:hypothetical protein